jgi:hypothetical protein
VNIVFNETDHAAIRALIRAADEEDFPIRDRTLVITGGNQGHLFGCEIQVGDRGNLPLRFELVCTKTTTTTETKVFS